MLVRPQAQVGHLHLYWKSRQVEEEKDLRNFRIDNYDILLPPFQLDYDHWNHETAQTYLNWFVAHVQERASYVLHQSDSMAHIQDSVSSEALLHVWKWFLRIAEIEPVPQQELELQRAKFARFGENFIGKTRLSIRTEYILRDIGMLVGAVFTANHNCLYWDFDGKPKKYIFLNRPVLKGFRDLRYEKTFSPVFEPVHMVGIQAAKHLDGTAKSSDLVNLYKHWEQHIP